jgi:PPOX class probable F420-dependent enzyme
MREATARSSFAGVRVARLATVRPDGRPHVVPVVFAFDGDEIVTPVDHKPKRTADLQRLRNIRENPSVALLADVYDEDWDRLWWVRVDGTARIVERGSEEHARASAALSDRYVQYRDHPLAGAIVVVRPRRWSGWSMR